MIKCIIVDDEPLAQEVLKTHIENIPTLDLIGTCNNAIEANQFLQDNDVDLMFLDINMPQINGIEFVKSLDVRPDIILTTAYSEYAIDGFEINAVDYLLKPISLDRLLKAINKVDIPKSLKSNDLAEDFIFVKADKKLVKINYSNILYIEGLKDYVIIRQAASRVITLQTMKSLQNKLPIDLFMRIHRSYIVNIDQIKAIVGNMVELEENGKIKQIPIGKNYREALLDVVNENRL